MLKAVIFDMDGVLVDTEPLHYRINEMVLQDMGHELPFDYYKQFIGSTKTHMWLTVIRDYGLDKTPDQLNELVYKKENEIIEQEGFPKISGAKQLVSSLKDAGFRLAVASSSSPDIIIKMTQGVEVYEYFDEFVSGETVAHPKPAPDVFLKAAECLGVLPEECLVIEDSKNGVCAAKAAGMACLGFANPGSGEQDLSLADYLFESYESIDPMFVDMVYHRSHKIPFCIGETKEIIVRELGAADYIQVAEFSKAVHQEADIELFGDLYPSKEQFESYITNAYSFFGYGYYGIFDQQKDVLLGIAGFSENLELGYVIHPLERRKGYAFTACKIILEYAREQLALERVIITTSCENIASVRVAESLSFTKVEEKEGKVIYARIL